jgi:hypothetical protein
MRHGGTQLHLAERLTRIVANTGVLIAKGAQNSFEARWNGYFREHCQRSLAAPIVGAYNEPTETTNDRRIGTDIQLLELRETELPFYFRARNELRRDLPPQRVRDCVSNPRH